MFFPWTCSTDHMLFLCDTKPLRWPARAADGDGRTAYYAGGATEANISVRVWAVVPETMERSVLVVAAAVVAI